FIDRATLRARIGRGVREAAHRRGRLALRDSVVARGTGTDEREQGHSWPQWWAAMVKRRDGRRLAGNPIANPATLRRLARCAGDLAAIEIRMKQQQAKRTVGRRRIAAAYEMQGAALVAADQFQLRLGHTPLGIEQGHHLEAADKRR